MIYLLSKFIFGIHIYLHTFPSIYSIYARHLSSWGQTSQNPKTFDISWFLIFFCVLVWTALLTTSLQLKVEKKGKIVNDLVDIDFEQTVMKWVLSFIISYHILRLTSYLSNFRRYDSTGMFHWTPARAIEECIIVSVHIVHRYKNLESSRWIPRIL